MFTIIKSLTKNFILSEPLANKELHVNEAKVFEEKDFYFEITSDLDFNDEGFDDETTTENDDDVKNSVHSNIIYKNNKNTKKDIVFNSETNLTPDPLISATHYITPADGSAEILPINQALKSQADITANHLKTTNHVPLSQAGWPPDPCKKKPTNEYQLSNSTSVVPSNECEPSNTCLLYTSPSPRDS